MSSAARSTIARMSTGAEHQLGRPGEVEEVGHDLAERLGLLADAHDVRPEVSRQPLEIEQAAVAVDRREAVAELVRDAGRQLAEPREAVLEPQLLFELHHVAEIGEEADRPVHAVPISSRIGDTVTPRCAVPAGRAA